MSTPIFRIALAVLALSAAITPAWAQSSSAAAAIAEERRAEQSIAARYVRVRQMTLAEFDRLRAARPVTLMDVREPDEFAVSHLPGAIRVTPDASADEVRRQIGPIPRGGAIVLYCTIGFRSSRLADRILAAYGGGDAPLIASLRGGVIAWSNDGRLLVRGGESTNEVHPFDAQRARMLVDPSRARGRLHGWPQ